LTFDVFEQAGDTVADAADRLCPQNPDIVTEVHAVLPAR